MAGSSSLPTRTSLRVVDEVEDVPRRVVARQSTQDLAFTHGVRSVGFLTLVIVSSIGIFLGVQAKPTLQHYGWSFFTEYRWLPNLDTIGIAAAFVGTVEVAIVALAIAFPLSLLSALFVSDWAPAWMRPLLIRLIDLMAAVPGIVFGLWVLLFIQPQATHVAHWLSEYFGWIPLFKVHTDVHYPIWDQAPGFASYEGSAFIAGIAVSMMIFPMATSVMREVFSEAPAGEKEAALALGATRWAMVRTVVLPFGRSGIVGGTMLALGRALGETISVLLIISEAFKIKWNILESGTATISEVIASKYNEATPAQLSALLTAGFVLFLMTLAVNTVAASIVARSRSGAGTEL
ncbi:MAG: phosphate transporter permease [Marmoricola sp.]|nr:phosphate transporter permease [Marmoricola sp.]